MTTYNPGIGFGPGGTYGNRKGPNGNVHHGMDYAAASGTPIPAAATGTVYYNGVAQGFGNTVILYLGKNAAGNDVYTVYAHMVEPSPLAIGEKIAVGGEVGGVGHTGGDYGNHLHFEVLEVPPGKPGPTAGSGTTGLYGNPYRENPSTWDAYPEGSQAESFEPPAEIPYSPASRIDGIMQRLKQKVKGARLD